MNVGEQEEYGIFLKDVTMNNEKNSQNIKHICPFCGKLMYTDFDYASHKCEKMYGPPTSKDVTPDVRIGRILDDYMVTLTKCVCGAEFSRGGLTITAGEENASDCPECGRELYFTMDVKVWEKVK